MSISISGWRPLTTALLASGVALILVAAAASFILSTFQPKTELKMGSMVYRVIVADNTVTREKGLSGVESLKANEGLLMVFESDDYHGIWMKNMKIPIDILWLDSGKKVIHTVKDASPSLSTGTVFTPKKPARYVVELPAGSIKQQAIRPGHTLEFDENGTSLWW